MEPDPAEWETLEKAQARFDEAYVDLCQAMMRIRRIYEIDRKKPKPAVPMQDIKQYQTETTGNFCPRCGSAQLDRKGGCVRCTICQFDLGCGGP